MHVHSAESGEGTDASLLHSRNLRVMVLGRSLLRMLLGSGLVLQSPLHELGIESRAHQVIKTIKERITENKAHNENHNQIKKI